MRRKWLIGLVALVILDTICWWIVTSQLAATADRWIAQQRRQGWVITEQERSRGGWPFAATLTLHQPEVAGGDALLPGGLRWSSQRLLLSVSAFRPTRLAIAAQGQQLLRVSGLPNLAFTAAALAASVKLWGGGAELARIVAAGVSGGIAGSRHKQDFEMGMLDLRLAGVSDPAARDAWPSATLEMRAAGIGLPDVVQWPLGARVAALEGTLELRSPAAGPIGPSDLESQARAWRDGGGQLDARDLRLRWGPSTLRGGASLGLDARLQPAGAGSADLGGSRETLAALAAAGVITPGLASTAGLMLMLLPRAPGDPDAVRLPFQLRDDTLSVGGIPVFALREMRWR